MIVPNSSRKDADVEASKCERQLQDKEKMVDQRKRLVAVLCCVCILLLTFVFFFVNHYSKVKQYEAAIANYNREDYEAAISQFKELGTFRNSVEMITVAEEKAKIAAEEAEYQNFLTNAELYDNSNRALDIIIGHLERAGIAAEKYAENPYYCYALARKDESDGNLVRAWSTYQNKCKGIFDSIDRAQVLELELDAKVQLFKEQLYDDVTPFDDLNDELLSLAGYDKFEDWRYYTHLLNVYEMIGDEYYSVFQYCCCSRGYFTFSEDVVSSWWVNGWAYEIGAKADYGEYNELYSQFQEYAQQLGCTIVEVNESEREWARKKVKLSQSSESSLDQTDELKENEYWCMGKGDTCHNKTNSPYDLYCNECDPDNDNIEG